MIQFNSLPVDAPLRITSKFGPRNTGIEGASTFHKGIDLGRDKTKPETNVLAVASGIVFGNYWNKYRGWVVVIQHNGFKTLYQHLKAKSTLAEGTYVKCGQVLGVMGNSSDKSVLNTAVHLHFELIENGQNIDPEKYLKNIVGVVDVTLEEAKSIIKSKAGLNDESIAYLANYKYGSSLIIKLAEAMKGA